MRFREYSLVQGKKLPGYGSCSISRKYSLPLIGVLTVFVAIIIVWIISTQTELTPVVQTSDGPVQGSVRYSRDGHKFWEFLAIPYAVPPLGQRKFELPEPAESWKEVKQLTSYPPNCVQYDSLMTLSLKGEMDCLFLNVFVNMQHPGNWTPSERTEPGNKPVLVYIHGGGYLSGGSWLYGPQYIMDHDVVLVTMNYRLGPYGFLNLKDSATNQKDPDVPGGNVGLFDQNLALRWVQKNIGRFGGNPNNVLLFGESAGASATHFHILSPVSRGLFHRAVLQSGSALAPWAFSKRPKDIAVDYAKLIGCPTDNMTELFKCFNATKWEDLVGSQFTFSRAIRKKDMFEPSLDGTFLNNLPNNILMAGDFPAIPTMWGVNSGEGGIRTGRLEAMSELIPELDEKWEDHLSNFLVLDDPLSPSVSKTIRQQYFGGIANFTEDVENFKKNLSIMVSDITFNYPLHKSALLHAKTGAPTYLYYFNYTSKFYPGAYNMYRAFRPDDWLPSSVKLAWAICVDWVTEHIFGGTVSHAYGVSHAEDLYQNWNVFGVSWWFSYFDADFSRAFVKSIVDFANSTVAFRNLTWPSINEHVGSEYTLPCILMDNEERPKVAPEPFGSRMGFWSTLKGYMY